MASVTLSEAEKVYIVHGVQVAPAAAPASAARLSRPCGSRPALDSPGRSGRAAAGLGLPCDSTALPPEAGNAGLLRTGWRASV